MPFRPRSPGCTLLTVASLCAAVVLCDADGFLATNAGRRVQNAASSKQISQDRVRVDAAHLAAALRALVGNCPHGKCSETVVTAARDKLGQEAGLMQKEDPEAAALVRSYARSVAPSALLGLMPQEEQTTHGAGEQQSLAEAEQPMPSGHTMSAASNEYEESISGPDGNGNVVTRTKHCKNGRCFERTRRSAAPTEVTTQTSGESSASASSDGSDKDPPFEPFLITNRSMMNPLSSAVRAMAQDMKNLQQSFGRDAWGFGDFMKDPFRSSIPHWDGFNSVLDGDEEASVQKQARSSAADTEADGTQALSSSDSTETHISNGRLVTTKRRCRDGDCTTTIVERKLQPGEQDGKLPYAVLQSS